jgi:hypothetical protein
MVTPGIIECVLPTNRRIGQHRCDNHTAGPDLCTHANLDIAEDLRARANQQAGC